MRSCDKISFFLSESCFGRVSVRAILGVMVVIMIQVPVMVLLMITQVTVMG